MARQRPSVIKRQREQTKRERQQMKAARRIERKTQDPASAIVESDEILPPETESIA
jgi:hypothetical protein